jgi:membrane-bound lytic murein transglycosylase D
MLAMADTVKVNHFLHFETFASLTNTCAEDLQKLNPAVLRGAIPQSGKTYTVIVPIGSKEALNRNRVAIMDSASKVGKKEIELLAKTYTGPTYGGDRLVYKVKRGDVLGSIAMRHRVSVKDLRRWNNLRSNNINVGQRLTIYAKGKGPSMTTVASTGKNKPQTIDANSKTYTVQPGDTLWTISKKFDGLTIEKIKSMNKLEGNRIQAGQKLIIGI